MTAKPAKRKPAAAKKAAAARAEVNEPQEKSAEWRGLTLTLPADLPGTLYFDFADLQEDSDDIGAQVRLLESLVGTDQVRAVRAKIAADKVPFDQMDDVLLELFDLVLGAYGLTTGESSASPVS